jgi:hypothetical protein
MDFSPACLTSRFHVVCSNAEPNSRAIAESGIDQFEIFDFRFAIESGTRVSCERSILAMEGTKYQKGPAFIPW